MGELVETARGDFFVEQHGERSGTSVVFVAGLGDDHASWEGVIKPLSRSLHCVTFDNRGIGKSPITAGPYTTQHLAADVEAITSALELEVVDAVGSSMGGAICQEWTIANPRRIRRLVLTNTWAQQDEWLTALFEHWINLVERDSDIDVLYQLALFCYSPAYLARNPNAIAEFLDAGPLDRVGFVGTARACQRHDALQRVGGIGQETLVIGGERDILTRPELSVALAQHLPRARLEWLATGHMTFWEMPNEWSELVSLFLRE